jgi:hypothetical protein
MTPRSMALAYRIWADCQAHGWERTAAEISINLGVEAMRVARVARQKGWTARLRGSGTPASQGVPHTLRIDAELATMDGGRDFDERLVA